MLASVLVFVAACFVKHCVHWVFLSVWLLPGPPVHVAGCRYSRMSNPPQTSVVSPFKTSAFDQKPTFERQPAVGEAMSFSPA